MECLANSPLYSKPDSQKIFMLWEARNGNGISIHCSPDAEHTHPWLMRLFVLPDKVRFPFNTWDSEESFSLSPSTINAEHRLKRCAVRLALVDREIPAAGENAIILSFSPQAQLRFIVYDRTGTKVADRLEHELAAKAEQIRLLKLYISEVCFTRHHWTETVREPLTESEEKALIAGVASICSDVPFLQSDLLADASEGMLQLPRWSTASRSCLVLIPKSDEALVPIALADVDLARRFDTEGSMSGLGPNPNVPEWQPDASQHRRFFETVKSLGAASQPAGVVMDLKRFRLYSLKTGVSYVGSKNERSSKSRLEDSCHMAMHRSECIDGMANNDLSFGVQTEALTITAPITVDDGEGPVDTRDGFQVRDLSCMRTGLDYLPCQAIPYALEHFDAAQTTAAQCAFWRQAFAVPLGRAKARIFLNYGLIHQSANAQNFLLGFLNGTNVVRQFVVRDVGDTCWHDRYVKHYFKDVPQGKVVYDKFMLEEADMNRPVGDTLHHYYCLERTSDKDYPPPLIVRLAANALLTHDFAAKLKVKERHAWSDAQIYEFTTGILDGFWGYFREAFRWNEPVAGPEIERHEVDSFIKLYGTSGKYPYGKIADPYRRRIEAALKLTEAKLANASAHVRKRGLALQPDETGEFKGAGGDDHICTLINAEELLLCARIEKKLGTHAGGARDENVAIRIGELLAGEWPQVVS